MAIDICEDIYPRSDLVLEVQRFTEECCHRDFKLGTIVHYKI